MWKILLLRTWDDSNNYILAWNKDPKNVWECVIPSKILSFKQAFVLVDFNNIEDYLRTLSPSIGRVNDFLCIWCPP
jgi:hypothetical protein